MPGPRVLSEKVSRTNRPDPLGLIALEWTVNDRLGVHLHAQRLHDSSCVEVIPCFRVSHE